MKTAFLFLHIQNRNQSNNTTKQTKSHNFGTEIINLIAIQNNNKTFHKTTTMNQFQDSSRDLGFTTSVPTFHENRLLQEAGFDESEKQANNADAFLLYSDDEVRMRALSHGRVGANQRQGSPSSCTLYYFLRVTYSLPKKTKTLSTFMKKMFSEP